MPKDQISLKYSSTSDAFAQFHGIYKEIENQGYAWEGDTNLLIDFISLLPMANLINTR